MSNNYGDNFIYDDEGEYTDINQYIAPPIVHNEKQTNRFAPQFPKPPKKKSKFKPVITTCIILAVVLAGGCYTYFCTPWLDGLKAATTASPAGTQPVVSRTVDATTPGTTVAVSSVQGTEDVAETIADDGYTGYMNGSVYIWDNKAFELFYGSDDAAQYYAQAISGYKQKLGDSVTVYNMVVPNHTEFGLPSRISDGISYSQRQNLDSVYNNYTADVKSVDIYNTMKSHINEYVFFDTDHHWTGKGAYYGYVEFAKSAGLEPMDIENSTRSYVDGFVGSLYTATQDEILQEYPDRVDYYSIDGEFHVTRTDKNGSTSIASLYYEGAEPGPNTYGLFLWGDNPFTKVINYNAPTDRKLAVVKESYGNAIVPYLAYNYSEIYVVDFRYYSGNLKDLCDENGISEVLFVNGIMSANTAFQVDSMDRLFN